MKYISANEQETAAIAEKLSRSLKPGDIIFLRGNLGTGKTVFARALIRALTGDPALDVPSPTFTLVQTYNTQNAVLWHFDLYRIKGPKEVYELGWEEAITEGLCLVEWPERLDFLAPADRLEIGFMPLADDPNRREITVIPYGKMRDRDELQA